MKSDWLMVRDAGRENVILDGGISMDVIFVKNEMI
jgi:hypothetical protein